MVSAQHQIPEELPASLSCRYDVLSKE